jgi:hypothetical protein
MAKASRIELPYAPVSTRKYTSRSNPVAQSGSFKWPMHRIEEAQH